MANDLRPIRNAPYDRALLVNSTRRARLYRLPEITTPNLPADASQNTNVPIVILPGPVAQDQDLLPNLLKDLTVATQRHRHLYLIDWQQLWQPEGQERFAPLLDSLQAQLSDLIKNYGSVHLLTVGTGALLLMRSRPDSPLAQGALPIISTVFYSPTLTLYSRRPRLRLSQLPCDVLIADLAANGTQDGSAASVLAARLSGSEPVSYLYESKAWYARHRTQINVDGHTIVETSELAGNWLHSILDHLDTMPMPDAQPALTAD